MATEHPVPGLVIALLVSLVAAGCLAPPAATPGAEGDATPSARDASWAHRALLADDGHDHADPRHHVNLSTPNFEILGRDGLVGAFLGTTAPGSLCGDAKATADGRRLAAVESRNTDVGFSLADVTDPFAPTWLGEFMMRTTRIYDLAIVADGRHVALVTSEAKAPDSLPGLFDAAQPRLEWRSACAGGSIPVLAADGGEFVPRPQMLILVSIEDATRPVIVDEVPLRGHGHGVFSTIVDDRVLILASSLARVRVGPVSGVTAHGFYELYEAQATAQGTRLAHLSTFTPPRPDDPRDDPGLLGHADAWLHRHPGTGVLLGYLVLWDLGLFIVDYSDLSAPRLVGRWTDWSPARAGYGGKLHSAHPLDVLWGDRHYTVIGPEWPSQPEGLPTGIVWVLDTTDPGRPFEVAGWTLPHEVQWFETFQFSPHYLTVADRTAFVSLYHAGLWALDLSPVLANDSESEFIHLDSVGVFMPTTPSAKPPREGFRWAPTLQEVYSFEDDTLVTFESNTGLYTLRFDAADPAPAPEPWPLEPVLRR